MSPPVLLALVACLSIAVADTPTFKEGEITLSIKEGERTTTLRYQIKPPFPRPPVRPHGCFRSLPQKANSWQFLATKQFSS
jgi:hypothetical protein